MISSSHTLPQESILLRKIKQWWMPVLFLLPTLLILICFMVIPIFNALTLSFQSWNGITAPVWVGLKNYTNLLHNRLFWGAFGNTIYFTVVTVLFQTTIPLLVANVLNSNIRGSTFFRTLYFFPVIISLTISGLLWTMIYEPNFGVLNEVLRAVGLKSMAQLWLANRSTVMPSIIVSSIWHSLGYFLVIFFAALQGIPTELYEAAAIDGAGAWKRLTRVTIPLLRPTIILVVVLNTINGVKVFDQIWVMTTGGPNHASDTLGTYLYSTAFGDAGGSNPQLGYAASIAIVVLILGFILSLAQIRIGRSAQMTEQGNM